MAIIELARSARGHSRYPRGGKMSDVHVFASCKKGDSFSAAVAIRFNKNVLRHMRWIEGDLVVAAFDNEEMVWKVSRTTDARKGNKLSSGGRPNHSPLTVRFTVPIADLSKFGLDAHASGYDCDMVSNDAESATFKMS